MFGVEPAFCVDALRADLLPGLLAERHFGLPVGAVVVAGAGVAGGLGVWVTQSGNRIWLKGVVWYVLPVGGPGVAAVGVLDVGPAVFTGLERSDQVVSTIL